MTSEELKSIHDKLDAIQKLAVANHREEFGWAQAINNRQVLLEKKLGLTDASMPFEPFYNRSVGLSGDYPEIFNKYGERMAVFFISDRHFAHAPNSKMSRYVIWDRYNYGLPIHFYTNDKIFEVVGNPKRKFAMMGEARSICPKEYEIVIANREYVEKNFEAIFTWDTEILSTFKNAKFRRPGGVWYGLNLEGNMVEGHAAGFSGDGSFKTNVVISEDNYKRKTKNISMVSSAKEMCPLHILRKKLALRLKQGGVVDTYGNFDGGSYSSVESYLEYYRYSIVMENEIKPYRFTEKILNCFAAETIPIYVGATRIGEFFDVDGIIQISVEDCNHIEDILARCTPEEYERRLPAVIDNFRRVQQWYQYTDMDWIYLNYIKP